MIRPCPICDWTEKTRLYEQDFHNKIISLSEKYEVVVCQRCGFAYADNIPSQAEFNDYYAVMSKYEFNDKDGSVSDDYLKYYLRIVDYLKPHLKDKSARILDIGCSTGGLLAAFKSAGYANCFGIDPSPACVAAAEKLYQLKVKASNLADYQAEQPADLVILSATLEHLVDFGEAMRKIRSLLNEQGLLFIEVPDAARFSLYITAPFQQFSTEHINYFSRSSLANLLARFSFGLVNSQPGEVKLNRSIDPDLFVIAKKTNENDSRTIIRDRVSERMLNDYIKQCSRIDRELKALIRARLAGIKKVIVWGVGAHTQRLIGSGLDASQILYFVDSNKRYIGKKLDDLPIKAPGEIKESAVPILISTYAYQNEIADQIQNKLKLNNEIIKIY